MLWKNRLLQKKTMVKDSVMSVIDRHSFNPGSFNLQQYLHSQAALVSKELEQLLLENQIVNDSRLISAMRYSVMAGGKRLRPVLCIAAAETVGGNGRDVLPAACALELIHTYSLIHDDLPAMDDDTLRRGKPTCHIQFDEFTAILAGDALLTLAFETLVSDSMKNRFDTDIILEVIEIISKSSGRFGMIEGQMQDILAEGRSVSQPELETLHRLKTGVMIQASVLTGALLGCGTPIQIKHLKQFSEKIGLAFQVTDDILNVEGDPVRMGKHIGTDVERQKSTYPVLMGLKESKEYARTLVAEALSNLNPFDERAEPLREIARFVVERKR